MRLKKGFTLAEILIVLMVIGALATMTIPSLMKGVTEAQYKAGYKKALNAIIHIATAEKITGNLPAIANTDTADRLFDILNSSLSVKGYIIANTETCPLGADKTCSISSITTTTPRNSGRYWYWIITEDNMAYLIKKGSKSSNDNNNDTTERCKTKLQIIASQEENGPAGLDNDVCFTVYVDVNGVTSGPNLLYNANNNQIAQDAKVPVLTNDRFPIYIGLDGATAGNQKTTITGRIAADLK